MSLKPREILTTEEIKLGLHYVVKDSLASQTMLTLTGGVFLVAFGLKLGASNTIIGLLAAIAPLTQLIQIPSIYLVEKFRRRRAIAVFSALSSRFFLLLIALIPFLFSTKIALLLLIGGLFFHTSINAILVCSWNSWMSDFIPREQLGSFHSKRLVLATGLGMVLSIASAFSIDYWKKIYPGYEVYAYSLLFFFGFLAGMVGVYFISNIPETRMMVAEQKIKFKELMIRPFKNANYKNLIVFLGSWHFAVNLAAPFFTVYMLKRLDLSLSFIILLAVLSQIVSITFFRIWGRISDRFSNKSVLAVSGPLFIICILAWTFSTLPEKHMLTIPLLILIHIFTGIATAGVSLAAGNIGIKLAPKGQGTSYLAAITLINSLAAGIAPILGGQFVDFFANRELSLDLTWRSPSSELVMHTLNFRQWDFLFFFAFLIGLYSIHRLILVKEVGEVKEKIVLNELMLEMRRGMRNLSTVGGLRQMLLIPLSLIKNSKKEKVKLTS